MAAKIVAFANQKGGVAKTTSVYNVATLKAKEGKKVLMVDVDPQSSLTVLCGFLPGEESFPKHDVLELFERGTEKDLSQTITKVPGFPDDFPLYIVPATPMLSVREMHLYGEAEKEFFLKDSLEAFRDYFDYIILDCPPNLGIFVINALVAADDVIIPVEPTKLAFFGLNLIRDTVRNIQKSKRMNPDLRELGVVLTRYQSNVNTNKEKRELLEEQELLLATIRKTNEIVKAEEECGPPVVYLKPSAPVTRDYETLAELIKEL